jgi:UDP-N-acetylmuramate--alanine ligase
MKAIARFWCSTRRLPVMTNIDREHMESYGSFEDLQQAFVDFANKGAVLRTVVACSDDAAVAAVLPRVNRPLITYGLQGRRRREGLEGLEGREGLERERRARGCMSTPGEVEDRRVRRGKIASCTVTDRERRERLGELRLALPGRHNLQNALAAVAGCRSTRHSVRAVARRWPDFHGAERGSNAMAKRTAFLVIDDYGHHPTEIAAVLAAARATLGRRLVVAFQPHRLHAHAAVDGRVWSGAA